MAEGRGVEPHPISENLVFKASRRTIPAALLSVCLVDRKRIELLPETCKAPVLPLSLTAHKKLAPGLGIEPRLTESKSVVLPLHNPGIKLVL